MRVCVSVRFSQNVGNFNCEHCPVRELLLVLGVFSLLLCTEYVLA